MEFGCHTDCVAGEHVRFFVGLTDRAWFDFLSSLTGIDEVNFWQPSGQQQFRALRLLLHAPGLTPTAVPEKLVEIQMIDIWIPTVDQRWLILPRLTTQEESNEIEIQTIR
jgi:hypothetical protein